MSNPTSNFGWQMPTATDLVTDLPADFEVFGQAVDTDFVDLLGGTTGQILSKTSATDLDFTWIANDQGDITGVTAGNGITVTSPTGPVPTVAINTAVTADLTTAQTLTNKTIDTATNTITGAVTLTGTQTLTNKTLTSPALTTPTISTLTTNGDLLYGTGSGALARRGIGSTGNVLTVSGGLPVWSAPAGGGKVLQVVSGTSTTSTSTSSTSYVTTNLSLAITPTLNTSKVLVLVMQPLHFQTSRATFAYGSYRLMRGATSISDQVNSFGIESGASGRGIEGLWAFASVAYLDSPATTSATTYSTQFLVDNSGDSLAAQESSKPSSIVLLEIGA